MTLEEFKDILEAHKGFYIEIIERRFLNSSEISYKADCGYIDKHDEYFDVESKSYFFLYDEAISITDGVLGEISVERLDYYEVENKLQQITFYIDG